MKRLLLLAPLLLAGCGTALTPTKVAPSFREVFVGLYAQQQELLGREAVGSLDPLATCRRTGTVTEGPGEDWVCSVQYVDLGTSSAQVFEVQVKPDGCWKATGPPSTQPVQLVDPITSRLLANPLAEFDGCLDTGW